MMTEKKVMPSGSCKLCLLNKPLRKSHFIPAAMYKCLRTPNDKNPNPVVVGKKLSGTSSQQMQDYVLCGECEDRFNRNGESCVLKWTAKSKDVFPLFERLNLAIPYKRMPKIDCFSGSDTGIDTNKLGYFALSVIWRAAVHVWSMPFGGRTTKLNLGSVGESIRKYLIREGDFPSDAAVLTFVCTDWMSRVALYPPMQMRGAHDGSFGFMTCGILFWVFVGPSVNPNIRSYCCVKSDRKLVLRADCEEKTIGVFKQLMATNR